MPNNVKKRMVVACFSGLALTLSGCASDPSPAEEPPVADATPTPAAEVAVAANLLQICDHAPQAFGSGDLSVADQARGRGAYLRGLADVADDEAASLLQPVIQLEDVILAAAAEIETDPNSAASKALQQAEDDAFLTLQSACVDAGSRVWGQETSGPKGTP